MSYTVKKFGWRPSLPDARDFAYSSPMVGVLPPSVDLCPQCPPIYNQGQLGSCTANAIAAAVEFDRLKQGLADWTPSRLFLYYNERAMIGEQSQDNGAYIRDGMKSMSRLGDCPETLWPYDELRVLVKPLPECYRSALQYTTVTYRRIRQVGQQLKGCLASGLPFVFGFSVYESFESAKVALTGSVPMPDLLTEHVLGGHAVIAVGYDDGNQRFLCRNSWGTGWGMSGYFTMPYPYLLNPSLSSDFWNITSITQAQKGE